MFYFMFLYSVAIISNIVLIFSAIYFYIFFALFYIFENIILLTSAKTTFRSNPMLNFNILLQITCNYFCKQK